MFKKALIGVVAALILFAADMLIARKKTYDSLTLELKNDQIEYGTPFDVNDIVKSHTGELEVIKAPDTGAVGEYEMVFVLSDRNRYGQLIKKEISRTIKVDDTKAPVIELEKENVVIYVGSDYDLKDNVLRVYDEVDGDIADYEIESDFDKDSINTYDARVIANDRNGLRSEAEFTVTVKARPLGGGSEGYSYIYDKLTSVYGYNRAAACGILANMRFESNFNPDVGDYYYGLCQWGGGRRDNLYSFCNSNGLDASSIDGQLAFMEHELSNGYTSVKDYLYSVENSASGAFNAAVYFCNVFEGAATDAGRGEQAEAYFAS